MAAFKPRDFLHIYTALNKGALIIQSTGAIPAAGVGVVGSIALDTKTGARYMKAAGGWAIHTV